MTLETRQEIVLHAVRWCNNILTEVLSNHASAVSVDGRGHLSNTLTELQKAEDSFRKAEV